MSDRERSQSPSAAEHRVVTISGDQSPQGRRDRVNHDSPNRNNKTVKRSYSRSPSGGRSRKMSYRGDRDRGDRGREDRDRSERDRDRGERGERRYRSRSRSRSTKRYKSSRYSHSRSRSHSRGRYGRSHSRSPMSSRRRHVGTRDNPTPSRCVGVFGLSVSTSESEIHHMFSKYGPVERVQIVIDAKSGQSRGFCFVYFESCEDAKAAKEKCNGTKLGGKNIRVDYSITQRAHTPTPGIYMGKPTYEYYGGSGGGGGGGSSYRGGSYRDRRSQSPPYNRDRDRRRRYDRSRSRSYSPREYYSKSSRY